jgi:tetratricopeptide (TPR) repeat protein
MKKVSLILLVLLVSSLSIKASVRKNKDKEASHVQPQVNIDSLAQQIALNFGDYDKAITFGYRILAKDPSNLNTVFELAQLYYKASDFNMSLQFCSVILNKDSVNQSATGLAALNLVGLKALDKAVDLYKVMAVKFNNPSFLYQASVIEFEEKKFDPCITTITALLKDSLSMNQKIVIRRQNAIGKVVSEEISLPAAAFNILGFVSLEKNNLADAKAYFGKALAIEPSFILAENNLKEVLKKEKESPVKKKEEK